MFSTHITRPQSMTIGGSRHFTKLVQDYLTAFESTAIREFFPLSPFERGPALTKLADSIVKRSSTEAAQAARQRVVAELRNQYDATGVSNAAIERNLDLLAKPTTLAVVTGQQVGIFGGPLYTLYKALSAVALARELDALLEYDVVPIFWQETEDHDLDESSHYGIFDQGSNYVDVAYTFAESDTRKQVGSLRLSSSLEAFIESLSSQVQKTEFTESALATYRAAYNEGATFAEAQSRYLSSLTADKGLLIMNANTHAIKQCGAELFRKELENAGELQRSVRAQTEKLATSYHTQIDPSPVNLFIIDHGKRYKLERDDTSGFRYDAKHITAEDLNRIVDETPECISPNVVMRPLFQDTVLPTISYIAGPGEIAYFAQLASAYAWAGIPMPLIAPRYSATIVEEKTKKVIAKAGTDTQAFIEDGPKLIAALTATADEEVIGAKFDEVAARIEGELESLRETVTRADGSLDGALTGLKGKLLAPLKDMRSKTLAAERKKSATIRTQLERALTSLLPDGSLQERKIGLLYFANKYGPGFIDGLKEQILHAKHNGEHRLQEISDILVSAELPPMKSR